MTSWTPKLTLKFIEALRSRRLLWDTKDEDYKHKFKKNQAWNSLAAFINMPRRDVELKVHNLRSQFRRELKKIETAQSKGGTWISRWFAFEALKFLIDADAANAPAAETDSEDTLATVDSINVKNEIFFAEEDIELDIPTSEPEENYTPESPPPNKSRPLKRKRKEETEIEDDEFSIYGKYVESELKSLKDEHSVIMAKHYISTILTKARLGKYRKENSNFGDSNNEEF